METILSKIAFLRAEIGRLQQEVANLEREHEKEILAAALADREGAQASNSLFGDGLESAPPAEQTPLQVANKMLQRFMNGR
jgi:hypothetical protein